MTISLKNTIVWNPSPDPKAPNYGFVEGVIPLLFHLAENFNLHLILLCPPLQPQNQQDHHHHHHHLHHYHHQANGNGKDRGLTIQEQEELKRQQQLAQESEREQILVMLRNAGLITAPGSRGPKLIDPRQLLICETEEGVSHVVRHLESHVHVEAQQNVLEMVQGVVPRVVFVQKRPHSRASSNASGQLEDMMTRSHICVRSTSRSSSSGSGSGSGIEDQGSSLSGAVATASEGSLSSSQLMGESFVEVIKTTPVVSGFVTQAGKKGYVEVTDQLMRSSLNPEFK
ncbi:hypothetical protein BGZ65_008777 [Modicella reniformis]|uniref:Uncharacterized protein n=1 Tax=Modicella reniformis TaxID=1440133 RepID=A0A9P6LU28_9FUNG|nr:hypothetical protein BGZ65_008777 [Modicella reniformis]